MVVLEMFKSQGIFPLNFSAISVLLGEAWKSLPIEDREAYSNKAKVLADEQKKIHPDCWKRKKTGGGVHRLCLFVTW